MNQLRDDKFKQGDTVWIKAIVERVRPSGNYFVIIDTPGDTIYYAIAPDDCMKARKSAGK